MKFSKIGFIGQGYIGGNYADDFEARGYEVIRYSLDREHIGNKDRIKHCDVVFVAVPTPTTSDGFDASGIREVMTLVGKGASVVIKSTVLPGTTEKIQKTFPSLFIFHSPEFLTEATAAHDAGHPDRNIVGMPIDNNEYRERAEAIMDILPYAPYTLITSSRTAEFIKYAGNNWFFVKVVFVNMLFDMANSLELDWSEIQQALSADPRIGETHLSPVHKSGRGAGGNCFIKDFAAFADFYKKQVGDEYGTVLLDALRDKNIDLLTASGKDLEKLKGVYGEALVDEKKRV